MPIVPLGNAMNDMLSQALHGIFCLENEHICAILELEFFISGEPCGRFHENEFVAICVHIR